jgi:hypothetical protein
LILMQCPRPSPTWYTPSPYYPSFISSYVVDMMPPIVEQEMEVEEDIESMDSETGEFVVTKETSQQMVDVGFSQYLGDFHSVIDTLGDEAKLTDIRDIPQGMRRSQGGGCVGAAGPVGVCAKLYRDHGCGSYLSTLTHSQSTVLDEGILFARGPVIDHQKKLEKQQPPLWKQDIGVNEPSQQNGYLPMVAPLNFGPQTLQALFSANVVYHSNDYKNEVGAHAGKSVFVRGWSMSDYTEQTIWPRYEPLADSNLSIRYGFPAVEELTLEAAEDLIRAKFTSNAKSQYKSGTNTNITKSSSSSKSKASTNTNPYVLSIHNLVDLDHDIVQPKQDAVVFVSAHYCKMCASLKPGFTRMARLMQEASLAEDVSSDLVDDILAAGGNGDSANKSGGAGKSKSQPSTSKPRLVFANANAKGQTGKQMTYSLGLDFVPSFVLYRKGVRYGEPLALNKFPSKKLELAVLYLLSGKEWDADLFGSSEDDKKEAAAGGGGGQKEKMKRTKLQ